MLGRMDEVEIILSKVKDTMNINDIRKLNILPIHHPGCDIKAGGIQLVQLKDIIWDVLDLDKVEGDDANECLENYLYKTLENLYTILYD